MDNTYTIYLDGKSFARACGTEATYELYSRVVAVAELLCLSVDLVWNETGEVVAYYDPEELEDEE